MNTFGFIINQIYIKKAEVQNINKLPYYLLLSKKSYSIFKSDMLSILQKDNMIDLNYFENMEVVVLPIEGDHVEIKGINV